MIDEDRGTVRAVAWWEVFPWLNLLRAFRLAIGFRVLLLSAVAILLTVAGWKLVALAFSQETLPEYSSVSCPWTSLSGMVPDRPSLLGVLPDRPVTATAGAEPASARPGSKPALPQPRVEPMTHVWRFLSNPALSSFQVETGLPRLAGMLLCGLWGLAVWALFGGAITRILAVQIAAEERVSWGAVVHHATSKWLSYFGAPLFPIIGILLAALPVCLFGLLLRASIGVFLVGLAWPVFLVCGLIMALLLLGLIFGWPLMWATISSEGTDSFDALSRSYAYVFQRPLNYLLYVIVAALVGSVGWLLVSEFAAGIVGLTYWAASWGSGLKPIEDILSYNPDLGVMGKIGAWFIHFWAGCVKLLAVGFLYSYFWSSTSIIYFLLRRDVDATEMDEVYLEEEEQTYGLPPLKTDESGAPVVAQGTSPAEPSDAPKPCQDEE